MDLDIVFDGNKRFTTRCDVVIYNKDKTKVLLFYVPWRNFYMLPGGRILFSENSQEAINREIKEELGIELNCRLIAVNEIIDKEKIMQYTFTYMGIYDTNNYDKVKCLDQEEQYFFWIDKKDIKNIDLRPNFCKDLIINNNSELKHYIEYVK